MKPLPLDPQKSAPKMVDFSVTTAAAEHFIKRGLSAQDVIQLKLALVDASFMESDLGFKVFPRVQADCIPFFDIDGTPLLTDNKQRAVRYRRDLPRDVSQERKYLSKKDSGCFAYLPQLDTIDWPAIAANPEEPLFITEGEYKAITSCKKGYPTVGLGGVWNFKGKRGLCTPLHKFEWEGRKVCIVFDADSECTPDEPFKSGVKKALDQFCAMMESRKATVFILYIARTRVFKAGSKMGLDDYFNAGGDWDDLFETRTSPNLEPQLAVMMERYAVARTTKPHLLDLSLGNTYTVNDFANLIEANKLRKNPDTGKMVKVAHDFISHSARPEFDEFVFDPSGEGGLDQERRVYNYWPGIPVQPKYDAAHEATYLRFMKGICGPHFDYVVNWFAHMVQRPWEKTTIALLCMSPVNGAGKGMLGEVHGELLGGPLSTLYGMVPLLSVCEPKFNSLIANRLLVQCDEADNFYAGIESKLKDIISAPTVKIERKGIDASIVANLMRLFVTTNSLKPMRLEAGNRRLFVWTPPITAADARGEWGAWVASEVKHLKDSPEGQAAVMHYLLGRDLSEWKATAPVPVTEEMRDLVEASPTKNVTVAQAIYDELESEGVPWVFVPASLSQRDLAAWTQFRELVKDGGGQKMKHSYTRQKKVIKGNLYDLRGTLKTRTDSDSTKWLAAGQITGEEAALSEAKVTQIFAEASGQIKPFLKGQY